MENTLYLMILLLWVVHALGLYRALRRTSPTPALFGTVLSILGLVVLAAGALPHVATAPISDLYQAPGATAQAQATLVLLWQGIEVMFDALLYTGLFILPLGLIALGTAMLGAPDFGRRIGRTTVALGVAGLAAAAAVLVGVPDLAAVGVLHTHRLPSRPGLEDLWAGREATSRNACGRMTGIARGLVISLLLIRDAAAI